MQQVANYNNLFACDCVRGKIVLVRETRIHVLIMKNLYYIFLLIIESRFNFTLNKGFFIGACSSPNRIIQMFLVTFMYGILIMLS